MRVEAIHFPEQIRDQLRLAFVDAEDLRGALRDAEAEPVQNPPGCLRARPTLAVPRPLDPETAELRELEVYLRPVGDALEVFAVRGLDLESLAGSAAAGDGTTGR
jgi:hypothetical protein